MGYWQDFGGRQNRPKRCLWFGYIVIEAARVEDKPLIPALAKIIVLSVRFKQQDK